MPAISKVQEYGQLREYKRVRDVHNISHLYTDIEHKRENARARSSLHACCIARWTRLMVFRNGLYTIMRNNEEIIMVTASHIAEKKKSTITRRFTVYNQRSRIIKNVPRIGRKWIRLRVFADYLRISNERNKENARSTARLSIIHETQLFPRAVRTRLNEFIPQ